MFDSGGGLEEFVEEYTATDWPEMIKILVAHHADSPVLPELVEIKYRG